MCLLFIHHSFAKDINLIDQHPLVVQKVQNLTSKQINDALAYGYGSAYYVSYYLETKNSPELVQQALWAEIEKRSLHTPWAILRWLDLAKKNSQQYSVPYKNILVALSPVQPENSSDMMAFVMAYIALLDKNYVLATNVSQKHRIQNKNSPFSKQLYDVQVLASFALQPQDSTDLDTLFLEQPATIWVQEMWQWLKNQPESKKLKHYSLYQAMANSIRTPQESWQQLWSGWGLQADWLNQHPQFLVEYVKLARKAGQLKLAIGMLENVIPNLKQYALYQGTLALAIMYDKSGLYTSAQRNIDRALSLLSYSDDKDKALWYQLAIYQHIGFDKWMTFLPRLVTQWQSAEYFRDLIKSQLYMQFKYGAYDKILQIYQNIRLDTDPLTLSEYAGVLNLLIKDKLLIVTEQQQQWIDKDMLARPWSYYGVLGMAKANKTFTFQEKPRESFVWYPQKPMDYYANDNAFFVQYRQSYESSFYDNQEYDIHAMGFFAYALQDNSIINRQAINQVKKDYNRLSTDAIRLIGRELSRTSYYYEALSVMVKLYYRRNFLPNLYDLQAYYPRAYKDEIEKTAEKSRIDDHVLYGLFWNESLYNPTIVSRANAIGLGQLLPGTANEVAQKIGLTHYNLEHPSDNILLSSQYLKQLIARHNGSIPVALMAYNAGPTNAKRWLQKSPNASMSMLIETAPFNETRNYVKDIVLDTCVYALLYDSMSPKQSLLKYFPQLL
jgi:soluble lytic murein transglycosylase-like protein